MSLARIIAVSVLLFGLPACLVAQTATQKPQMDFSAEEEQVHHPAPLPDPVFIALSHTDRAKVYAADNETPMTPAPSWFSAEKLRSPAPSIDLYMVMAEPPLTGANICGFWLVRHDRQSQTADVLWEFATHDVNLRYRRGHRYPDIHTTGMTAVHVWETTFVSDGGKYVATHTKDYDIR